MKINYLTSKTSRKVNALSGVLPYISLPKKKKPVNSFFDSQFSFWPLIWMFHSLFINNKINFLQERCLRLLKGYKSSFEKLSEKDKSVTIHTGNL